ISVRESLKAPGWASLITSLSDTAYHSFIGEVEALNTTTIRRLIRSRRHQLLAIALTRAVYCHYTTSARLVGARGIGPAVDRLKAGCSAIELCPHGARPGIRTRKPGF